MPDPITTSQPDLLRLATAGSVGAGKSTLIANVSLVLVDAGITWSTFT